jgi:hypothetical protein
VCRSWRAFLADPSLWQVLDLTLTGGVAAERVTANLVRGAVARAAGQLKQLSYNGLPQLNMVALVVSDGAQLQQVNTDAALSIEEMETVFAAAPRLQALNARVSDQCMALLPLLRNDPPYGPLRISRLTVSFYQASDADVLTFAAAVAAHESLKGFVILNVRFARGLNALVDAVAGSCLLSCLWAIACTTDAETAPTLTRLLERGSLTDLNIFCVGFPHAPEASMPALCAALRACRKLMHLRFALNPPHDADRHVITELLDAAASLPALSVLDVSNSRVSDKAATGRAFGALLSADLPSLHTLDVSRSGLGDEGLAPLLDGLASNTHLRQLDCLMHNDLSEAFKRDRLDPALAALAARAELNA